MCVLMSGGVDSCVLLADLVLQYRQIFPLYIQAGLVWKAELYWLSNSGSPRAMSATQGWECRRRAAHA